MIPRYESIKKRHRRRMNSQPIDHANIPRVIDEFQQSHIFVNGVCIAIAL